jgi:hypothetical protein
MEIENNKIRRGCFSYSFFSSLFFPSKNLRHFFSALWKNMENIKNWEKYKNKLFEK